MAQNFLYMLEFVVDDLLITRPNYCAPEEYPTCVELTFRSHVFVSICDKEFGGCIDTAKKSGKCCLFSLETPINRNDRLQIHVYKKRTDQCKFLIGQTEIPIHRMFDKVTEDFYCRNPNWDAHLKNPKLNARCNITKKTKVVIDNECGQENGGRKEELCPTFELSKKLLALANLNGSLQTGNIVLIMRLACMGPTIVSPFLFGKQPPSPCEKRGSIQSNKSMQSNKASIHSNRQSIQSNIASIHSNRPASIHSNSNRASINHTRASCEKEEVNDSKQCRRYFASTAEKGCPCDSCPDEEDRCPKKKRNSQGRNSFGGQSRGCPCPECDEECEIDDDNRQSDRDDEYDDEGTVVPRDDDQEDDQDDDDEEENSVLQMEDCILCQQKQEAQPETSPEEYDEFEANLNGSGLTIRVLKNSHRVENVIDIDPELDADVCCDPNNYGKSSNYRQCMDNINGIVQNCSVARNYIAKRTGGSIINDKSLPVVRGNIKYSGCDTCLVGDNSIAPLLNKMPPTKSVDDYRKLPNDIRNCCFQVNPNDIDGTLRGINAQAKKNGIEICRTKFDDPDTDVFLVKLGNKKASNKNKQCNIEIELRTPKEPANIRAQKWTKETQVDESILDATINNKKRKPKKKSLLKRRCYKYQIF